MIERGDLVKAIKKENENKSAEPERLHKIRFTLISTRPPVQENLIVTSSTVFNSPLLIIGPLLSM